jgi:tyrosine-protein kinase Etk/Wzc
MATFLLVESDDPGERSIPPLRPGRKNDSGGLREVSLQSLLGVLRRQIRLVLGLVFLTLLVTTVLVLREAPVYRATAVVRLVDARHALAAGFTEGAPPERRGSTVDPILSLVSLMRSRGLLGQVVDQERLRLKSETAGFDPLLLQEAEFAELVATDPFELYFTPADLILRGKAGMARAAYGAPLELGGVRLSIAERPDLVRATFVVLPRELAIDRLLGGLQIRPREQTDIVDISYASADPRMAQRITNALVDLFRSSHIGTLQEQSTRRRIFLEQQLAQNDSVLAAMQRRISGARSQQHVYNPRALLEAQQSGLLGLEVQTEELSAERRMYESILYGLERGPGSSASERLRVLLSAPGIASNPVIAQIYAQLSQYQTERDTLTTGAWSSAATHPDVQRLNALIRSREADLVRAVRGHIAYLDERVAALGSIHARSVGSIRSLLRAESEEASLSEQAEPFRQITNQLREEYQRARIAEAVAAGQLEIIDLATLPYRPSNGGLSLKLAIGLMLGLALGAGGAFAREAINTSIRRRQELEEVLRVPTLAVIPQTLTAATAGGWRLLPPFGRARNAGLLPMTESAPSDLVTISAPLSPGAESYRMLRTGILFARDEEPVKSIVVTSAVPEEGKTTTAANLAVALAQEGLRTLIIDCDLRRAKLHRLFRTGRSPGLVQVVQEQVPLGDAIRTTSLPGLSILPAGLLPPGPSDLLASARLRELLQQLMESYDLVILDAPPLLALADAAVLTALADGVILVVRAGKTARGAMEQAQRQLTLMGARLLGAVLNDPDAQLSYDEDYYYAYDYAGGAK